MDYLVGLIIGMVLGLTGAGGSVFAVPLLIYLLNQAPQDAIGISLGAVCASACFGTLTHMKSKQIQWLPAIVFAVIGGLFSPLGVYLNKHADPIALLVGFSILVIIVAIRLWQQASTSPTATKVVRSSPTRGSNHQALCRANGNRPFSIGLPCILGISSGAISTGILSGLFGVGGGFLIVPTLLFLTAISIQQAVATSLAVISFVSFSGFVSYLSMENSVNLSLLTHVAIGGIAGMMLGIIVGRYIAGPLLQKLFSILMLIMAAITASSTLII